MWLIVGLGNPGQRYADSRHNFGFMVLDGLASMSGILDWQEKFNGQFIRGNIGNRRLCLLKPMTFMNLSGQSVARAAGFYHFEMENIIVVHDELDLPFGTVRIKKGGGTAGHNGIASLKQELGDSGFTRVRMGIGREFSQAASKYVLDHFSTDEMQNLTDVIDKGVQAVESIVVQGVNEAMNVINIRGGKTNES